MTTYSPLNRRMTMSLTDIETQPAASHGTDEHAARMRDWYGFTAMAGDCPMRVAGERCHAYRSPTPCICETHFHILDHARVWRSGRGDIVLTAEPYGFSGDDFAALERDLDDLGLVAWVSAKSPWYPGRTALIVIHRAES